MTKVHQTLWGMSVQAAEHHDAELVHDYLRHIQPVQISVKKSIKTSDEKLKIKNSNRYKEHIPCRKSSKLP